MVFYRKYRPQTIEDLDNNKVRETLFSVLSSDSMPHAFLFTGPKGLGKTSTARIVAKAVNCEKKAISSQQSVTGLKSKKLKTEGYLLDADVEPCNKCDMCLSITNGSNLDVLEIDAASNRGIDEIRDLREKVRLSPVSAQKKVYIIDEVHMLTTEAFNALLKTLEEPPSHALFILCTTEPHRVPATIMSRCFHVSFTLATKEELIRAFERIAKGEKIDIEKEALLEIAGFSDGSFRDGTKILEEMVALSNGEKITKDLVEKKYHVLSTNYQVIEIINLLKNKKTKEGLKLISELVEQGIDIKYFIEQVINSLHELLLEIVGVKEKTAKSENIEIEDIKKLVELFTKASNEIKFAVLPQLPLEMAVVEWGLVGSEISAQIPQAEAQKVVASKVGKEPLSENVDDSKNDRPQKEQKEDNTDLLKQIIEKVKAENFAIAGVLRGCFISRYDSKELIIETAYKFHKEKLEEKNNLELLSQVIKEVSGKKIDIKVVLKN